MPRRKYALSVDDRHAVDLLLEHGSVSDARPLTRISAVVAPKRLRAVTKILTLLDALPLTEPPTDLVAKTLQRIDRESRQLIAHQSPRTDSAQLHS